MTGPNDAPNSVILEKLNTLANGMDGLKQDVHGLKQDMNAVKQDVHGLMQVTTELKQGYTELTAVTQGIMVHMDRHQATTAEGFARVDREFASLRGEMNRRFDRVEVRLDALQAKRRRPKNRD